MTFSTRLDTGSETKVAYPSPSILPESYWRNLVKAVRSVIERFTSGPLARWTLLVLSLIGTGRNWFDSVFLMSTPGDSASPENSEDEMAGNGESKWKWTTGIAFAALGLMYLHGLGRVNSVEVKAAQQEERVLNLIDKIDDIEGKIDKVDEKIDTMSESAELYRSLNEAAKKNPDARYKMFIP
jgi:hypothetical protein